MTTIFPTSRRFFLLVAFVYSFYFSPCSCKQETRTALTGTTTRKNNDESAETTHVIPSNYENKSNSNIHVDKYENSGEGISRSESAELIISNFLQKYSDDITNGTNKKTEKKPRFHVQGWRWHTLSLVRDTNRLEKLALQLLSKNKIDDESEKDIESAASHVIDFNMKGLHSIENDLFFPWLKKRFRGDFSNGIQLNTGGSDKILKQLGEAYIHLLNDIDRERDFVAKLGDAVREQSRLVASSKISDEQKSQALSNIAQMSAALTTRTRKILEKEEQFLIPPVAMFVPEKEQKSFNSKVIRNLGLLNSRLHLVGMYDAVWELNDENEKSLFNEVIPTIPRMMIPRWKRNLYTPQAGALQL